MKRKNNDNPNRIEIDSDSAIMPIILGFFGLFFCTMIFSDENHAGPLQYVTLGAFIILILSGIGIILYNQRANVKCLNLNDEGSDDSPVQEHAVVQLRKNYEVLRKQTNQGFLLSAIFMIVGFLAIISGWFGETFGLALKGRNLTSFAGIIMEFFSGTALLIYKTNFKRLNETSDRLESAWRILAAYRLTEALPEDKKSEATTKLIEALIAKDIK